MNLWNRWLLYVTWLQLTVHYIQKQKICFDKELISKMKKGAYLINTARGKICNREAIADALKIWTIKWICRRCLVSSTST